MGAIQQILASESASSADALSSYTWALWLEAFKETGFADGDPVGTATDQSGNSRNATAAGAARPTYKTSIVNSKPVYRFDGNDILATSAFDLTGTSVVTMYIVLKPTGISGNQWVAEFSTDVTAVTDGFLAYSASGFPQAYLKGNVGNSIMSAFSATIDANWKLWTLEFDKTRALLESQQWVAGSAQLNNSADSNNTNAFGNRALYIGARSGVSSPLTGDIAFLGIVAGSRNTAIETALTSRYAL